MATTIRRQPGGESMKEGGREPVHRKTGRQHTDSVASLSVCVSLSAM